MLKIFLILDIFLKIIRDQKVNLHSPNLNHFLVCFFYEQTFDSVNKDDLVKTEIFALKKKRRKSVKVH